MSFSSVLDLLRAFALHLHWIIDHIQGLQRNVFEGRNTITFSESSECFESKADCSTGNSREDIVVTRLRHKYVNTAIESHEDATAKNPLALYKFDTPDNKGGRPEQRRKNWFKLMEKLETHYCISSERKIALTVHDGFAFAIATNASNSKHGKNELLGYVLERILRKITGYFLSAEQKKRFKEIQESVEKLFSTLGEDIKDMICLDMLMTAPAFQGQGYGSALVDVINDIADSQSRRVYLMSSDIANTGFYNSHGFETTATATLGEGNPTWTKKPVTISLMVRGASEKLA